MGIPQAIELFGDFKAACGTGLPSLKNLGVDGCGQSLGVARSHAISCCVRPKQWKPLPCSCRVSSALLLPETADEGGGGSGAGVVRERLEICRAPGEFVRRDAIRYV